MKFAGFLGTPKKNTKVKNKNKRNTKKFKRNQRSGKKKTVKTAVGETTKERTKYKCMYVR